MATIDYKEKYEQALEVAQETYETQPMYRELLEKMFPELAETEDKEIYQAISVGLTDVFNEFGWSDFGGIPIEEIQDWLKKQSEQKPEVDQHSLPISDNSSLPTFDESIYHPCTDEVYEQKLTEWSEEDVAMFDSAIAFVEHSAFTTIGKGKNNVIAWLKNLKDGVLPQPKQEWSEEDDNIKESIIIGLEMLKDGASDKSLIALYNKKIDWLKSLKDRVQPKQEWSEGDKRIIDNLISQLGNLYVRKLIKEGTKDKYVNWLKNLKDKVFPQPNQEWSEVKSGFESLDSLIRTFNNYMKGE